MALLMANPDGTSNAKVGDIVVTGGGVFQKTEGKSVLLGSLAEFIGKHTTGSYEEVGKAFRKASDTGKYTKNIGVELTPLNNKIDVVEVGNVDGNGIASVSGYNPAEYNTKGGTAGGLSNIIGYVVLFLVGVALLDRFMSKGA